MGLLRTLPGNNLSPNMKLRVFTSVQPSFVRIFTADTSLAQAVQNQAQLGAANGAIFGTPTIGGGYLGCIPNNGGGLRVPLNPVNGPGFTAFIVAQVPNFSSSGPANAQLLGNWNGGTAIPNSGGAFTGAGMRVNFTSPGGVASLTGFAGNTFNRSYAAPLALNTALPNVWKLFMIQQSNPAIFVLSDLTDGLSTSITNGQCQAAALITGNLQVGSFLEASDDTNYSANTNIAMVALYPQLLLNTTQVPDVNNFYAWAQSIMNTSYCNNILI